MEYSVAQSSSVTLRVAQLCSAKLSLAQSMRELGFSIVIDDDSFKLDGVPDAICDHFSKRAGQIKKSLKERVRIYQLHI